MVSGGLSHYEETAIASVDQCEARIDYDLLLADLPDENKPGHQFFELAKTRNTLLYGQNALVRDPLSQGRIDQVLANLASAGYLMEKPQPTAQPGVSLRNNHNLDFVNRTPWRIKHFRTDYPLPPALVQMTSVARFVTDTAVLHDDLRSDSLVGPIADPAIAQFLHDKRAELPIWYQADALSHADIRKRRNGDKVVVSTVIKNPFFDLDIANLQHEIETTLPPIVLNNLGAVVVQSLAEIAAEHGIENPMGCYSYDSSLQAGYIQLDSEVISEKNQFVDAATAEKAATKEIMETLYHEAGHALHHVLPEELLEQWEKMQQIDPGDVSGYVAATRVSEPDDLFAEDFAETHRLFMTNPYDLMLLSPKRYALMQLFYEQLHPESSTLITQLRVQTIQAHMQNSMGSERRLKHLRKAIARHV